MVSLVGVTTLVLEIKRQETEADRSKHEAAQRWVEAVNNWRRLGRWQFYVCDDPYALGAELDYLLDTGAPRALR